MFVSGLHIIICKHTHTHTYSERTLEGAKKNHTITEHAEAKSQPKSILGANEKNDMHTLTHIYITHTH